MTAPVKTVSSTYGYAIIGLLLGIVGMQRFYLRRHVSATLMTIIFLVGLFLLTSELILKYYTLLDQLTSSLSALSDGSGFASIPEIGFSSPQQAENNNNLLYGKIAAAVGVIWWMIDLLLIPGMVKKYKQEHVQ